MRLYCQYICCRVVSVIVLCIIPCIHTRYVFIAIALLLFDREYVMMLLHLVIYYRDKKGKIMKLAIVTSIYDVKGRSGYSNRTVDEYIAMLDYILDLGLDVFCFTESAFKDRITRGTVIVKEMEQLPTYDLIVKEGWAAEHAMENGKAHPGHHLYTVVNNAKAFLVQEVAHSHDYDLYVWLDAGIAHVDPVPKEEALEALYDLTTDKITLLAINYPKIDDVEEFWSANRYSMAGGLMAFPPALIEWFIDEYHKTLAYAKEKQFIGQEDQIIPVFATKHTDKFDFRFTDYRVFTNLIYVKQDIDVIIRNIPSAPRHIALSLIKRCIASIESGRMRCSPLQFVFFICAAHFVTCYVDKSLSDRLAKLITALLLYRTTPCTKFKTTIPLGIIIKKMYPNIDTIIAYNNVTVENSWGDYLRCNPNDVKLLYYFL